MFCPNCANQLAQEQRFCKACGMDLQAAAQALANRGSAALPAPVFNPALYAEKMSHAMRHIFSGFGLLVGAILVMFFLNQSWSIWVAFGFVMAAFGSLGKGVGDLLAARALTQQIPSALPTALPPTGITTGNLGEYRSPVSVTEQTTRNLKQ